MKIEMNGHYYYRDENHIPKRITIIAEGDHAGFYWCLNGHLSEKEIAEKLKEKFLIHQNKVIQ